MFSQYSILNKVCVAMCSVRCTVTTVTNAAVIIVLTCYLVIVFIVVFSKTPTHCAFTNNDWVHSRTFLS